MGEILGTGQVSTPFFFFLFKKLLDNVYLEREVAKQIVNEARHACANLLSDLHLSWVSRKPHRCELRHSLQCVVLGGKGEVPAITPECVCV